MQSDDEREMCTRTVYCTNIDKKVYHHLLFYFIFLKYIVTDIFGKTTFSLGIIVDRSNGLKDSKIG
jgi:hypothetical protein